MPTFDVTSRTLPSAITSRYPPPQLLALAFSLAGNAAILFSGEAPPPATATGGAAAPPGVLRSNSRSGRASSSSALCADGELESDSETEAPEGEGYRLWPQGKDVRSSGPDVLQLQLA